MSERTTIGGTVYESVGSSSSNLLLKCNGTARIQWGNKLIDLIKNGKIATSESSDKISIISNESEIKSDGIYILDDSKSQQLLISKNGEQYNFSGTDLYISATKKQDITAEQRIQALENIGMYFNTLDDVQSSGIQNGIVYVLENDTLYTIKDGTISEFEAKLKTVTVEKEEEQGEVINSSFKIVLSVLDSEYLILENKQIVANYDVYIKNSAQIGSEGATKNSGYRLYFEGGLSYLDVDCINVRKGIPFKDYVEVTYDQLMLLINSKSLEPHTWYLITNFQNPWKLPANALKYNRPILVQALTKTSLYVEGMLFKDRRVSIHYDPSYREPVFILDDEGNVTGKQILSRGRITWMKDGNNNEANFDFLDYTDCTGEPIAYLHESVEDSTLDKSIFPKNSKNNKLTVYDLKGIVIKDGVIDNSNTTIVEFQFPDTIIEQEGEPSEERDPNLPEFMEMSDNTIECRGLILTPKCTKFCNNTLSSVSKLEVETNVNSSSITNLYTTIDNKYITSFLEVEDNNIFDTTKISHELSKTTILGFINSTLNTKIHSSTFGSIEFSKINGEISGSTFKDINKSTLDCKFYKSSFQNIENCVFNSETEDDTIEDTTCHVILKNFEITPKLYPLLYDITKLKDVYTKVNKEGIEELQIIAGQEHSFIRGMIVMHSGISAIPTGWAICDGRTHEYEGVKTTTPNLVGRFIKAVDNIDDVKEGNIHNNGTSNEFTLEERHLPRHSHPHEEHTHTLSSISGTLGESGDLNFNISDQITDIEATTNSITLETGEDTVITDIKTSVGSNSISGGNHTHNLTISGGNISSVASTESEKTWSNESFQIEPNYYSLIFIMKL